MAGGTLSGLLMLILYYKSDQDKNHNSTATVFLMTAFGLGLKADDAPLQLKLTTSTDGRRVLECIQAIKEADCVNTAIQEDIRLSMKSVMITAVYLHGNRICRKRYCNTAQHY